MKKSVILVFAACFIILAMICSFGLITKVFAQTVVSSKVKLQWDLPETQELPEDALLPDGYIIFQRLDGEEYDYTQPVVINGITSAGGDIPPDVYLIEIPGLGVIGSETIYHFVCRAFADEETGRISSENSNEVTANVDLRLPPSATNLVVTYDKTTGEITAVWEQSSTELVDNWKIYTSDVSGGPFELFDTIQNTGQQIPTIVKSISVPDGVMKTIYMVVVSFRTDELYSSNSQESFVVVDKRVVGPPKLRIITVTIPVTN